MKKLNQFLMKDEGIWGYQNGPDHLIFDNIDSVYAEMTKEILQGARSEAEALVKAGCDKERELVSRITG